MSTERIQPRIPKELHDWFEAHIGPDKEFASWSHLVSLALTEKRGEIEHREKMWDRAGIKPPRHRP